MNYTQSEREARRKDGQLRDAAPDLLQSTQRLAARLEAVLKLLGATETQIVTHPDLIEAKKAIQKATAQPSTPD